DPVNMTDHSGLFACAICGDEDGDPCDPFGPSVVVDGIELDRSLFCFPDIPTRPFVDDSGTGLTRCKISLNVKEGGSVSGSYSHDRRGPIADPNNQPIGGGAGTDSHTTSWWFFFYEVGVTNIRNASPADITIVQTVQTSGSVWIDIGQ